MGVASGPNIVEDGLVLALDASSVKSNSEISFNKWNNVKADFTTVSSVGVITCLSIDIATDRFFGIDYVTECTQGGDKTFDNRPPSVADMNTILDNMADCKEYQTGTYNSTGAVFGAYGDAGNVCTLRFTGFGVGAVIGVGGYFTHTSRQCRLTGDLVNSPVTITSPSGGFVDPIVLTSDPADIQFSNPGEYGDPWYIYWIGSYNQVPYSIRSNTGFVNGATYSSDDGGYLDFDGSNDYVDLGDTFDDIIAGADKKFSMEIWINPDTVSGTQYLISKHGDSNFSENNREFYIRLNNDEIVCGAIFNPSTSNMRQYTTSSANLTSGSWHHIVLVYDGSIDAAGRFTFYVNGQNEAATETYTNGSWGDIQDTAARFAIGAMVGENVANSPLSPFDGKISNTKVYSRLLTASEVEQNYNALKGRYGL